MKYVSTLCALGIVGLLLATSVVRGDYAAGQMSLTRVGGYYTGSGGEFTMAGSLDTSAYDAKAKDVVANGFQTFCVELGEYTANPVYTWVSTTNIDETTGAVVGPGSHAVNGGKTHGDNLETTTAYLYTQFATGVLSGYNYTPGVFRAADAQQLQKAIWALEESLLLLATDVKAKAWVTEATSAGWTDIGNVRVLNNYASRDMSGLKQDQLYLSAVPLPAAVLLGLPLFGLIGLVRLVVRRRNG